MPRDIDSYMDAKLDRYLDSQVECTCGCDDADPCDCEDGDCEDCADCDGCACMSPADRDAAARAEEAQCRAEDARDAWDMDYASR